MDKQSLTRDEAGALLDTQKAVLAADMVLTTRTAEYIWHAGRQCWQRIQGRLHVTHCQGLMPGQCWSWNVHEHAFERCDPETTQRRNTQ